MARITHFGVGGWCTRTVGSSGLKLKAKLGHISPAAMRRAKSFIDLAVRAAWGCDVRFGSKADICSAKRHVCFAPKSGHVQRTRSCLLRAKSGHGTSRRNSTDELALTYLNAVVG
jgi:hypothetical protein